MRAAIAPRRKGSAAGGRGGGGSGRAARATRCSSSPSRPSRSAPQWKQNSASDSNDSLILPLTASAAALQHGDEEAVGAVAQGRHLQRLGRAVGGRGGRGPPQRPS